MDFLTGTFLVVFLIGFVLGMIDLYGNYQTTPDTLYKWIAVIISSVFIGGISSLFFGSLINAMVATELNRIETYRYSTNKIYSVHINQQLNGDFFLGTGSFDSKEQYVYFIKNEDGAYVRSYVSAATPIYESDIIPPSIRIKHYDYQLPSWFKKNANIREEISKREYTLFVPNGTIIKELKIE